MENKEIDTAEFGYAEVNITPLKRVETIGFGREDELSRGVLHDLFAEVSIWEYKDNKCCLITIDHIGFSKEHSDYLRINVGKTLGISKEKVMICFTHTHSAPNDSTEKEYFNYLFKKVIDGTNEADKSKIKVLAAWGNAYGDIGINRRKESGIVDKRIGILKVVDAASGDLKMIFLRLTAHANVLKADNYLISPDYLGTVRDLLKEKYGCEVMISQGASGNIAPKYFDSEINPPDACDERFIRSKTALNDNGIKQQKETVEIQYFNIGNGIICGVPNEIMCEFAINAKQLSNNEFLYLGGYTNGCGGYFPTEEEYDKGGFEVYYSLLIYYIYQNRVFPLNRESASILVNEVVKDIDDCYKNN